MAFLKTSAYMFKYDFADQLLIYAQKPDAKACASFETWNEKHSRWIRKGSKGIALLNDDNTLRYVFDIKDTRSPSFKPLHLWRVEIKDELEYIHMLENKYGNMNFSIELGHAIIEMSSIIAEENMQDYLPPLLKFRKDSELEHMEEHEIMTEFKSLLANSIAFEIIHRSGLNVNDYFTAEDFYAIKDFNSIDMIMQLGTASRDLCEIGMNDISAKAKEIMIRTFEQSKQMIQNRGVNNERSDIHERIDVQSSGRLSNAKSESRRTNLQQPIRKDEIQLPQNKLSGTSSRIESEEQTEQTFKNSQSGSNAKNRNFDGGIAEETASSRQGNSSDGMGTTYGQSKRTSRGNNLSRDNLQLDLGLGGEEIKNALPPFDLQDLPALLREDVSLQHSREKIQQFFMEHTDDNERTQYLAECYDDTLVETFRHSERNDFSYIGYKKDGNGLNVWAGSWQNKKSKSYLSFFELQLEIAKLIENNEYLYSRQKGMTPIQLTYEKGLMNRNVDYYLFSYKSEFKKSSAEIIEFLSNEQDQQKRIQFIKDFYPNQIVEMEVNGVTLGFKKEESHLHIYMGTYDNQKASSDYSWSLVESEIDGMILSRYFDSSVQIPTVEEQQTAIYENEEQLKNGIYFSQEEIDRALVRGSGFVDGKYRIYQQMLKKQSISENATFLKEEYGTGGSAPAIGLININHDSKGITFSRSRQIGKEEITITLNWKKIAKRINELVAANRYLSKEEMEEYPKFLQKQMEQQLEYERKMLNHEPIGVVVENSPDENVKKDYRWKIGDKIYKGIDEYTIIEDGDQIAIQSDEFPLFIDYLSKKDFKNLLKENPLNDKLLVAIEEDNHETSEQQLFDEYIPVFIDRIQRSEYYPRLRNRDTDVHEAELLIREAMIDIMTSINMTDEAIYNLYTTNNVFREKIIDHLIDKVYNDVSTLPVQETSELYNALYELVPNILDVQSYMMIFYSKNSEEHPLTIFYNSDEKIIEMYHWYELNGIEITEPHMKFFYDSTDRTINPIYYSNPLLNVEFDTDNDPNEFLQNDMLQYALTWIQNIKDKDYYLESEQIYMNDEKIGTYHVDYNDNGEIVYSNMPYDKLIDYANAHNLTNSIKNSHEFDSNNIIQELNNQAEQKKSQKEPVNYHIEDEHLGAGTPKERYRNNIAAIRLLFSLEKENRLANKDEQEILAKYVGWGGLSDVFDSTKSNWANEYTELKSLLNDEEYTQARESTLTAFYTPPIVIDSIYSILDNLGFKYGNILEPACGTGNFLGRLPDQMKDCKLYGIELDSITGRIAKQLYQKANITVDGYENTNLPDNFFDIAISNVPFGQFKVSDKRYNKLNFNIHDYYFAKTLDKVRPGGIVAFVTSKYTMDKANSSVRKYISERAELLGAIRLPNTTFSESANTKAVSDILILKKRERPMVVDEQWLYTQEDANGFVYNAYFQEHPDMVLGNFEMSKSMYGRDELTVVPFDDIPLKDSLEKAVSNIQGKMDQIIFDDNVIEDSNKEIVTIPADPTVKNFSYTLVDDDIYFRENSIMTKMELTETARNRITGMIEIRDCVRNLIDYQKEDFEDLVIENEQKRLNILYDAFTEKYGLINSRGNSLAFRDDSSYYLLCSLENLNEDGTLKSKADMFSKRTIRKHVPVESVETSNEALMISLAEKAKIDFDYMNQLTGFDKEKMVEDLKGVIYRIPDIDDNNEVYVSLLMNI